MASTPTLAPAPVISPTLYVFILTFTSALLSGVGVLPFLLLGVDNIPNKWIGLCNSVASGLMLSAVLSLSIEALEKSYLHTVIGACWGVVLMYISEEVLKKKFEHLHIGSLDSFQSRKVILVLGAMTVHAFGEGMAMGLSFSGNHMLGAFITFALAIHNIPEGLAIAVLLLSKKMSMTSAFLGATLSHLPQPLLAVISFVYMDKSKHLLPLGLSFAGGAMGYVVFMELIPDAFAKAPFAQAALTILLSLVAMQFVQIFLIPV